MVEKCCAICEVELIVTATGLCLIYRRNFIQLQIRWVRMQNPLQLMSAPYFPGLGPSGEEGELWNNIRETLRDVGLRTKPDFEVPHIDAEIEFREWTPEEDDEGHHDFSDPVPRVGQLDASSRFPTTVNRDDEVRDAVTIMMMNDYSQLPVMQGRRDPDGYVSWETIGIQRRIGDEPQYVRDCMEEVTILDEDRPLFRALPVIAREQFVLIRGSDQSIVGLVTVSDITFEFKRLAEQFLHIGSIENHLRRIIQESFSPDELEDFKDPSDDDREVDSVADLTFGEYVRILEKPSNWERVDLELSRTKLRNRLEEIRRIRNEVMHFHPDELPDQDRRLLKRTVRFMRDL